MYIINENFEDGEVYTSLIDGTEFEVKEIKEKDKKKYVEFYCLKDKKIYEVDYKTAMRLLLEKKVEM